MVGVIRGQNASVAAQNAGKCGIADRGDVIDMVQIQFF